MKSLQNIPRYVGTPRGLQVVRMMMLLVILLLVPLRFGWASDSLLPSNSSGFGRDPDLLFAPKMSGDGQTPFWRIIEITKAYATPWSAVGNILVPGVAGYCSAFLINPRVVLAANHCLYRPDFNRLGPDGLPMKRLMDTRHLVFVAALHDEFSLDVVPVQELITGGWSPGQADISKDWMIAVLKRPVASVITPFAFTAGLPHDVIANWGKRLVVAAYPGETFGFSAVLRFSFNCSILNRPSASVFQHDCQTEGGSSGGPIFIERDGKRQLIGIHVGRHDVNTRHNVGVWINSFITPLNAVLARVGSDGLMPNPHDTVTSVP